MAKKRTVRIGGTIVKRGETRDIHLKVSQRYTGDPVSLPIRVIRGKRPGPAVFVTAAIHGDEINGTGIIHELTFGDYLDEFQAGTLILVPVVNIFGFDIQQRYMPDRRDLNRSFPGTENGSLTSRIAYQLFNEIVKNCDYGIDLHTAAVERVNFPNVRGDLTNKNVRRIAHALGCELIINGKGPEGSFRRAATAAGCPTIILEAGEARKIEPAVLDVGIRGVCNVLKALDMLPGEPVLPTYQARVERSTWVRAEVGGILRFHIAPGEPVETGQPIATNTSVFGRERNALLSPVDGVVLGMTTLPTVKPGEPVCHIAVSKKLLTAGVANGKRSLQHKMRGEFAKSINVTEREGDIATGLPEVN